MAASADDIKIRYSGGSLNFNPQQSLGGFMSPQTIPSNTLSNLFDSVVNRKKTEPLNDYRAIYVLNSNEEDLISEVKVWVTGNSGSPANITIGIPTRNEVQQLLFSDYGDIESGFFTIKFKELTTDNINWVADTTTLAANIKSSLENLSTISEVDVSWDGDDGVRTFSIEFVNADGNKQQPLIEIASNTLLTSEPAIAQITVATQTQGTPISDVATNITFSNNAPAGISFVATSEAAPITVGTLAPNESFFVWIKRSIPANSDTSLETDQFTLFVSAEE